MIELNQWSTRSPSKLRQVCTVGLRQPRLWKNIYCGRFLAMLLKERIGYKTVLIFISEKYIDSLKERFG